MLRAGSKSGAGCGSRGLEPRCDRPARSGHLAPGGFLGWAGAGGGGCRLTPPPPPLQPSGPSCPISLGQAWGHPPTREDRGWLISHGPVNSSTGTQEVGGGGPARQEARGQLATAQSSKHPALPTCGYSCCCGLWPWGSAWATPRPPLAMRRRGAQQKAMVSDLGPCLGTEREVAQSQQRKDSELGLGGSSSPAWSPQGLGGVCVQLCPGGS